MFTYADGDEEGSTFTVPDPIFKDKLLTFTTCATHLINGGYRIEKDGHNRE